MKIAICYAGHLGTTKEGAEHILSLIKDAEIYNLFEKPKIDFASYDLIIFGTNIRVGKPSKVFKKYAKKYRKTNIKSNCYYMAGIHSPLNEDKLRKLLGPNCKEIVYGGGEYRLEGATGFAKMVNNAAISNSEMKNTPLPKVDFTYIDEMISSINLD